jgi:hypothetical protein
MRAISRRAAHFLSTFWATGQRHAALCENASLVSRLGKRIRVFDESGAVMETHVHKGDFKEW